MHGLLFKCSSITTVIQLNTDGACVHCGNELHSSDFTIILYSEFKLCEGEFKLESADFHAHTDGFCHFCDPLQQDAGFTTSTDT